MENAKPEMNPTNAADATQKKVWVDPKIDEVPIADRTQAGFTPHGPFENFFYRMGS